MPDIKIRSIWLNLLIFFAGFQLRAYQLGEHSLWLDEAFTWVFTRLNWLKMFDTVRLDGVNPPFYYMGTKIFIDLLGEGEIALRLLSLISGAGAVYFAWLLGKEVGGLIGGLASAWFIAFHPMAIHYARDARPYSLALALAIMFVYVFVRLRQNQSLSHWVSAFVLLVLGQLTHYFFVGVGGAVLLIVFLEIRQKPLLFRNWMFVWLLAFLPLTGWLGWYFSQTSPFLGIGWIQQPGWEAVFRTWWNLLSGYASVFSVPATIFGLITLFVVVNGIFSSKDKRRMVNVLLMGIIVPVVTVWLISQRVPIYVDRYFIVLLPFVAYLLSMGADGLAKQLTESFPSKSKNVFVSMTVLAIIVGVGLWSGWQVHSDVKYSRENWRGLVSNLEENGEGLPVIWLSEPENSVPLQYYFRGDLSAAKMSKLPPKCESPCLWVMRQPYTATHAFSQAISLPGRPSFPKLPAECRLLSEWASPTGIGMWQVICEN